MDQDEKRRLENALLVAGLPKLTDPDLIQQLANLVSDWPGDKHEYMRDLINQCDVEDRYHLYHAIAPKLKFKALSLPQYEAQIALKAGEMVSQGRMRVEGQAPRCIEIGGHKVAVVSRDEADGAVATVRCHVCNVVERFLAETPVGAMIEARKAGWTRTKGINKETCAECTSDEASEELVILSRNQHLVVNDRRRVN